MRYASSTSPTAGDRPPSASASLADGPESVRVVTNEVYNTPRDVSPSPASGRLSVRTRTLESPPDAKGRSPDSPLSAWSGGKPAKSPAKSGGATGKAKAPAKEATPKAAAKPAAKPAWADAAPVARPPVKERIETITGPERRQTGSRPGTPLSLPLGSQPPRPSVPMLRLQSSSEFQQSGIAKPVSQMLRHSGSGRESLSQRALPRLSTTGGLTPRSSAGQSLASSRLGSPRTSLQAPAGSSLRKASLRSHTAADGRPTIAFGKLVPPPPQPVQQQHSRTAPRPEQGMALEERLPSVPETDSSLLLTSRSSRLGRRLTGSASFSRRGSQDGAPESGAGPSSHTAEPEAATPHHSQQGTTAAQRGATAAGASPGSGHERKPSPRSARGISRQESGPLLSSAPLSSSAEAPAEAEAASSTARGGATPRSGSRLGTPRGASPRPSTHVTRRLSLPPVPRASGVQEVAGTEDKWVKADRILGHSPSEIQVQTAREAGELPSERSNGSELHAALLSASLRPKTSFKSREETLSREGPREAPVKCTIVRDTRASRLFPTYKLFLDDPAELLLAARKRKKSKTSNYILSADPEDLFKGTFGYCGKVRSNFVGTQFMLFDGGAKPSAADGKGEAAEERKLVGLVRYETNVLGTRGPRKMTVLVPRPVGGRDSLAESGSMTQRLQQGGLEREAVTLRNKPPKWNEQLGAYCLNFGGRVTHASVKNFQLVAEEEPERVVLQFGKVGKDRFSMDFLSPLSAVQAFGICLTSFDGKLACE